MDFADDIQQTSSTGDVAQTTGLLSDVEVVSMNDTKATVRLASVS